MYSKSQSLSKTKFNKIRKLQKQWKNVRFLIIDESSLVGLKMLNEININLQLAKNSTKPFGGLHILFSGDFAQLSPVSQKALYFRPEEERLNLRQSNESFALLNAGRLLWKQLTHSIILTEQCRQTTDKEFSALLSRLRNGTATEESLKSDFALLNNRIVNESNFMTNDWRDAPIIVGRNLLREKLNLIKIRQYAHWSNNTLFVCKSTDKLIKNGANALLTKRVNAMISILEEKDTENLMTNLPLVYKGKYLITKNLAVRNGIVNGTEVELHAVCTQENVIIDLGDPQHSEVILCELPKYLLVKKINEHAYNNLKFENLQDGLIPIFPQTVTFSVKPKCAALGTKSVSVRRSQFPLTPAYALTAYKAQGKTLNKLIIDLTKPATGKLDFDYAYVALSRAKSLNDILILREFDNKILSPKIPVDYFLEMERLKEIEVLSI